MQDNNQDMKIITVDGSTRGTLRLDQAILIFHEKNLAWQKRWLIPIELISVSTNKRLNGYLLIKGLMLFLASVILAVLFMVITTHANFSQSNSLSNNDVIIILAIFGIGITLFFFYLWQFITDRKTIVLNIKDDDGSLEFYQRRKYQKQFSNLLKELESRKQIVEDEMPHTLKHIISYERTHNFRRMLCFIFVLLIPACSFEILWLLWLGAIPVVFWLKSTLSSLMQPKPYRRAISFAQKEQWSQVEEQVLLLDDHLLTCIPMVQVQLDMYLITNRFDHALEFVGNLPEEYHEDIQELQSYIWLMKRIRSRMSGDL